MKSIYSQMFLLLAGLVVSFHCHTQDSTLVRKIDSLSNSLVTGHKSAGIMLGIRHKQHPPYLKAYGLDDIAGKKPVTLSSKFRIASLTKPFTAVAIMTLIEKGKIRLDDKLSKFFKDYPKGDSVTIYQLLSHTSGIPDWWEGETPADTPKDFPMSGNQHLYLQSMKKPFLFSPGTRHAYSNSGYVLLGEIIEKVSGLSYIDYLRKNIFDKAGMQETVWDEGNEGDTTWATGYQRQNDSVFTEPKGYTMPFTAGSLRSTTGDLIKFLDALYKGRIIKKKSLAKMTAYALTRDGISVDKALFFPAGFTPTPPPAFVKRHGYGLGFTLTEIYGTQVIWHSGGIAGFNAIMMYIPKSDTKLILLANTENGLIPIWNDLQRLITTFK